MERNKACPQYPLDLISLDQAGNFISNVRGNDDDLKKDVEFSEKKNTEIETTRDPQIEEKTINLSSLEAGMEKLNLSKQDSCTISEESAVGMLRLEIINEKELYNKMYENSNDRQSLITETINVSQMERRLIYSTERSHVGLNEINSTDEDLCKVYGKSSVERSDSKDIFAKEFENEKRNIATSKDEFCKTLLKCVDQQSNDLGFESLQDEYCRWVDKDCLESSNTYLEADCSSLETSTEVNGGAEFKPAVKTNYPGLVSSKYSLAEGTASQLKASLVNPDFLPEFKASEDSKKDNEENSGKDEREEVAVTHKEKTLQNFEDRNEPGPSHKLSDAEKQLIAGKIIEKSVSSAEDALEALNDYYFSESKDSLSYRQDDSLPNSMESSNVYCESVNQAVDDFKMASGDRHSTCDSGQSSFRFRDVNTNSGNSDFEDVSFKLNITTEHLVNLLKRMKSNHYFAEGSEEDHKIYSYCKFIFEKDYSIKVVNNRGALSKNYPTRIIVPYADKGSYVRFDPEVYTDLTMKSLGSRLRDRFVAPAIFWNGKFVCRAATLTVKKTAIYEKAMKPESPKEFEVIPGSVKRFFHNVGTKSETLLHRTSSAAQAVGQLVDGNVMKQIREDDIKLMDYLDIMYICDLMYENKKKKFWISVGSSEKKNQEAYSEFQILQMPYPGCKFFRQYHQANRNPKGLTFDWTMKHVDAVLRIPDTGFVKVPLKDWSKYKEWDIIELTQNYMELIILHFIQGNTSLLVHCISGWDRTPLFVALLRISLWADGLVHHSLNAHEMVYLTLGYDWYLFGHNLPARMKAGEEILHFCYKFLEYFAGDCFSAVLMLNELRRQTSGPKTPHLDFPFHPGSRRQKLHDLKQLFLKLYNENILDKNICKTS